MIDPSWNELIERESSLPYWQPLRQRVTQDRRDHEVYPPLGQTLAALRTPLPSVRCVIIGQDPYHGPGMAHGLAFSVPAGVTIPMSLRTLLEELAEDARHDLQERARDHGAVYPRAARARTAALRAIEERRGDLTCWADSGVLLLNECLTVRRGEPFSHRGLGWEHFTDAVLRAVLDRDKPCAFIGLGTAARQKLRRCGASLRHPAVILTPHPAARPPVTMRGSRPFSRANDALRAMGGEPVDWEIRQTTTPETT